MSNKNPAWWQGSKGEWYVVVQFILFALIAFYSPDIGLSSWARKLSFLYYPGLLTTLFASVIVLLGLIHLGRNLSVFPHPKDDAQLVETGVYGLIRHPIYGGLILLVTGYGLMTVNAILLIYGILLFVFFEFKTKREERYLCQKFPRYKAYQARVKKLIPFIY
ncbi:MAG TPA: isoprenylcysteine carboxylmethyltransferase family protein [Trueperaceae bacterium]|nr:isoprenylcysteine carboxylmethyltransferase family protein [Trueperaceae bacterium]